LANSYTGQTIKKAVLEDDTTFEYKIYGQKSQYFQGEMSQLLKQIKPDIFHILLDTFMLYPWFLNVDTSPAQTMFWFPSDGGAGMPAGCHQILQKINKPVAMSQFGQKQVKDYYNIDVAYIPHGTEPDRFYKLPDKKIKEIRQKWGLLDKYVIGVVARNQPRKMLDRTLKAFKLVAEKVPNAVLLLHLDPVDPAAPWPILNIIKRYNLENRVKFTGMSALRAFDWEKMNEIYNLMDVFFLSTSGEGFGIPIIEAMSCEIPVVATSYTTTPELVEKHNAGYGIKLVGTEKLNLFNMASKDYDNQVIGGTLTGSWEVERGLIDINDAAEKLIKLTDPELRKKFGINGRKAIMENYDFNKHVGPVFEKIMEELIK